MGGSSSREKRDDRGRNHRSAAQRLLDSRKNGKISLDLL